MKKEFSKQEFQLLLQIMSSSLMMPTMSLSILCLLKFAKIIQRHESKLLDLVAKSF